MKKCVEYKPAPIKQKATKANLKFIFGKTMVKGIPLPLLYHFSWMILAQWNSVAFCFFPIKTAHLRHLRNFYIWKTNRQKASCVVLKKIAFLPLKHATYRFFFKWNLLRWFWKEMLANGCRLCWMIYSPIVGGVFFIHPIKNIPFWKSTFVHEASPFGNLFKVFGNVLSCYWHASLFLFI